MNDTNHNKNRYATIRIVAIYALFGSLWIYSSENILGWLVHDPAIITRIGMYKGLLFILLTAAMLYLLINQHIRKLAASEKSLRESEERFRAIFEMVAVGVALIDPRTGKFLKINAKYCDIVGYSAEEMLEKRFQDITHPDDLTASLDDTARLLTGELKAFSWEKRYIHRDGSIVWVNLTVSPLWQEGQEPSFQIAVVEDVTARKAAEAALLLNEERYRKIVEDQTETISKFAADGTFTFVNDVYCRFFGKTRDEVLGCKWHPAAFPDDLPDIEKQLCTLSPSHPVVVIENRVYSASGAIRWMQFVNSGLFDTEGRLVETQSVGRDITERKEAELALQASDEKLGLALAASNMGVWEWNLQSNAVFWSPECYKITGLQDFNETFDAFAVLLHPDDAAHVMDTVDRALANRNNYTDEFRIIRPDGRLRWLLNHGRITYDENGNPLQLIGTVQDITVRKQAEEQQKATIELLRLCNNGKSTKQLMQTLMLFFRNITGCEAVGIRLRDGDDFPYFVTVGFSDDFILVENSLCAYDQAGELVRDSSGHPALDCMCGNILCGRFDPSQPFFTAHGSFWSSSTTELLANTTDADRQAKTRNRCNGECYESVALLPIRFQGKITGLFQFNDKRRGRFTAEQIMVLEGLVDYVSVALAKLRSDDALRVSESKFRSYIDNSPDGVFIADETGRYLEVNRAASNITGYSEDELLGMSIPDLLPPESIAIAQYNFQSLKEAGYSNNEFEFLRKDGACRWWSVDAVKLSETRYLGFAKDVTERKRAEDELHTFFDLIPDMVCIASTDGYFKKINPMWQTTLGYTEEEILATPFVEFVHPDDLDATMKEVERQLAGEATIQFINRYFCKDGSVRWLEWKSMPAVNNTLLYASARDITERKRAEDELRNYARRLIEIEENLRKKLAAELHDEIGRDLTAIGMNLAIVSDSIGPEAPKKLVDRIEDSGRLVEAISITTRNIMAGLRPPVLDDYGLLAAIHWHTDLFSKRTGIEVFIQADESFPRLTMEKETSLFRISQEALMNVAKHADTLAVTITLSIKHGMVLFAISDDGCGLLSASSSDIQKGSGWGMKIMRERAELIGGFFHVESAPGKGTAVSIVLPLEDV